MTEKTVQARKAQANLQPIQKTNSDTATIIYIIVILLACCFAGCTAAKNTNCKGNKSMLQHQGYSRKPFKF